MTTPTPDSPAPNYRTGKICYVEIPAVDVSVSANFYQTVFGWSVRERGDGSTAFDDTTGTVSGAWVLGRPPSTTSGVVVGIMVADAVATLHSIVAAGGGVVQPINPDETEVYALFRDPAGNVLSIYQQRGLAEQEAAIGAISATER